MTPSPVQSLPDAVRTGQRPQVGPYQLLEVLGTGGMGTVYRARHQRLGRQVALKVLDPDLLDDDATVERFQREMRAVAQLAHPNIVTLFEADQVGSVHYLAMEYVQGADLSRLVAGHGPLPVEQVCEWVRQAACALEHIHRLGLVHRDVKPANLLIQGEVSGAMGASGEGAAAAALETSASHSSAGLPTTTPNLSLPTQHSPGAGDDSTLGTLKVLDLGLARFAPLTAADEGPVLTRKGELLGTADYIAPEQALDAHHVDGRADIYSLGCTCYHLLAGQPPFPEGSVARKLLGHQLHEPVPIEQVRPGLPAGLGDVVRRMMAKRLEERYASAADVAAAITAIQQGQLHLRSTDPLCPSPTAAACSGRWRVALFMAASLLVGALGFLLPVGPAGRRPPASAPAVAARPPVPTMRARLVQKQGDWQLLFNGKDLDDWEPHAGPTPACEIVTLDGQPVLRIGGRGPGTLTSLDSFENYQLRAEYCWGPDAGPASRNAGLLYHAGSARPGDPSSGRFGLEYRLAPGLSGSLALASWANATVETLGTLTDWRQPGDTRPHVRYAPGGQAFSVPLLVPPLILPRESLEHPLGKWNSLEILTVDGRSRHQLNGQVVLEVTGARRWTGLQAEPVKKGKIQLQSAGGAIYYRSLMLRPLSKLPAE